MDPRVRGSQDRSLRQLSPSVKMAHLLGQRGPGADHRPAHRYCGQHDGRIAAEKPVAVEAPGRAR
jgi:hypothetical protein